MQIEVIDDAAGLDAQEHPWRAFVEQNAEDAVFLTWDWAAAWWRTYGVRLGRLHVVRLSRGGQTVGLAPLYVAPPPGGVMRGATLRFVGTGGDTSPDHLQVVCVPGEEQAVAESLAAHLAGPDAPPWDVLQLTDLAADAPTTEPLARALQRTAGVLMPAGRTEHAVCPFVDLPGSPDELLFRFPRKRRYNLKSARKRLEEQRGARFVQWSGEDAQGAVRELAELHRLRFEAKGAARHAFSTPQYVAFHADVAARFHRRGLLRLYCVQIGGKNVAMQYCFKMGERIYHFQSGFDPDFAPDGVGQALMTFALERAVGEGARRFDLLKGDYPYKSGWATGRRRTQRLCGGRRSPRGFFSLYESYLRPRLGRLARELRR